MRKIEITTINGTKSEITIDCGNKMVDKNSDWGVIGTKLHSWKKINCITNGTRHYLRDFHTKDDVDSVGISENVRNILTKGEVFGTASGHQTGGYPYGEEMYVTLMLDEYNYKLLQDAIAQDAIENTTDEAAQVIKNKKEKERQFRIDSAKYVLEKSKSTRKLDGKLMTEAQAKKWKKEYNDLMNEGGDGYIPDIITVERVEYAKRVLAELGVE